MDVILLEEGEEFDFPDSNPATPHTARSPSRTKNYEGRGIELIDNDVEESSGVHFPPVFAPDSPSRLSDIPEHLSAESQQNQELDTSPSSPSPEKIPTIQHDVLVETQRGMFLGKRGYFSSNSLLPFDPKPWVNGWTGEESITDVSNTPPPVGWHWTWEQWNVDMGGFMVCSADPKCGYLVLSNGDVDPNGWQYAGWFGFARLMRWFRFLNRRMGPNNRNEDRIGDAQISFNQNSIRGLLSRTRWHGTHPFPHAFVRQRCWIRERQLNHRHSDFGQVSSAGERFHHVLVNDSMAPNRSKLLQLGRSGLNRPSHNDEFDEPHPDTPRSRLAGSASSIISSASSMRKLGRIPSVAMLIQLLKFKSTDPERLDCLSRFLEIPVTSKKDNTSHAVSDSGQASGSHNSATPTEDNWDGYTPTGKILRDYFSELVCLPHYLPTILQTFLMQESRYQALEMIRSIAVAIEEPTSTATRSASVPTTSESSQRAKFHIASSKAFLASSLPPPSDPVSSRSRPLSSSRTGEQYRPPPPSFFVTFQGHNEDEQRKGVCSVLTAAVDEAVSNPIWNLSRKTVSLGTLPDVDFIST